MDISGSYTLNAPRERVWQNLLDPDMLQRTIPGCEKLEQIGPDEWRMRVNIGIAAVKGVYEGTLRMTEQVAPEHYRMVADGTGARSVLHGEGTLTLEASGPNTTVVRYQGEAQINGPLAGVANRVAGSVSRMLVNQFFGRFQREMDATGVVAEETSDVADSSAAPAAAAAASASEPVLDASTSGVWEVSLPEARPLDDEQAPATALPLDPTPAASAAEAAAAPAATMPTSAPAAAPAAVTMPTTSDSPASATSASTAPVASGPTTGQKVAGAGILAGLGVALAWLVARFRRTS